VLWVLLGALPFLLLREFIRRLSMAHLQMGVAIAIDGVVATLQLGTLLLLASTGRLTTASVYATMGAACAVASIGWFLARPRPMRFSLARARADWWRNWAFGRWAMATHVIGCAGPYLMPWLLTTARGEATAGVLAACISVVGMASMFMTGISAYLTPRAAIAYAQGGAESLRRVLRMAAWLYVMILGSFALFVLLSGDFLLVLAFGTKYAGFGLVVGTLAISTTILSLGLTAGNGLWAMGRPQDNFAADVCTLVVTLVIMACLVAPLGIYAAVLADLIGNITGASIRFRALRRLLARDSEPRVEPA
jgi:O-antigen/teichoic acid export membrane protein